MAPSSLMLVCISRDRARSHRARAATSAPSATNVTLSPFEAWFVPWARELPAGCCLKLPCGSALVTPVACKISISAPTVPALHSSA